MRKNRREKAKVRKVHPERNSIYPENVGVGDYIEDFVDFYYVEKRLDIDHDENDSRRYHYEVQHLVFGDVQKIFFYHTTSVYKITPFQEEYILKGVDECGTLDFEGNEESHFGLVLREDDYPWHTDLREAFESGEKCVIEVDAIGDLKRLTGFRIEKY